MVSTKPVRASSGPKPTSTPVALHQGKRRKGLRFRSALLLVVVGVMIAIIVSAVSGGGGPSAKITATIESVTPLDAQHVRVYVMWDNIGKGTGTESCVINVTAYTQFGDEDGSGSDSTEPNNPLKPGQTALQYQDIVVTDNHAGGVTSTKDASITDCS